jgi:hypothetical protein
MRAIEGDALAAPVGAGRTSAVVDVMVENS